MGKGCKALTGTIKSRSIFASVRNDSRRGSRWDGIIGMEKLDLLVKGGSGDQ